MADAIERTLTAAPAVLGTGFVGGVVLAALGASLPELFRNSTLGIGCGIAAVCAFVGFCFLLACAETPAPHTTARNGRYIAAVTAVSTVLVLAVIIAGLRPGTLASLLGV